MNSKGQTHKVSVHHGIMQSLWTGLCVLLIPAAIASAATSAQVDPALRAALGSHGAQSAWVILKDQADLSAAPRIKDWDERGRYVHQRLTSHARQSQGPLNEWLLDRGLRAQPYWIVNAMMIDALDLQSLDELAQRADIEHIAAVGSVQRPRSQMNPWIAQNKGPSVIWHVERIQAPMVWSSFGATGQGIVVANIDDGVHYTHPALIERYRGNLGGGSFDHNYSWYDPAQRCPTAEPCADGPGHGTASMGVMVADANDAPAPAVGVAPGARWIAALTDYSNTSLLAIAQWMLAPTDLNGANPNPAMRPHVVNNSWVGFSGGNPVYRPAVQAWIASGIFSTFSAGNGGPDCGTVNSPADYAESYAIGASDINDALGDFSARGSINGSSKPNLTAPGKDVVGTVVPNGAWDLDGDGYATDSFGGTSWSAPHVAGTVALLWSGRPELIGDIAATRSLLDQSAIDESDTSCGGVPGNDHSWGEGRLDAFAAYQGIVDTVFGDQFESP